MNDIGCFTRCIYFDGKPFSWYFTDKHICGLQYAAGFTMASTAREVVRCIVRTRCESCTWNDTPGNFPSSTSSCKPCPILKTTKLFVSKVTREQFTIRIHTSCETNNIFYLIECRSVACSMWGKLDNHSTREWTGIGLSLHMAGLRSHQWPPTLEVPFTLRRTCRYMYV